jgi:hypothetical protein
MKINNSLKAVKNHQNAALSSQNALKAAIFSGKNHASF